MRDLSRRRGNRRPPRQRTLVVFEGEQTEARYFNTLRQHLRLSSENLLLRSSNGGSPEAVVDYALRERRKLQGAPKEAAIDSAWVVFDIESPTSGAERAVERAGREGWSIALSNPCFEFWLLLHESNAAPQLTAKAAKERCESRLAVPGKPKQHASFDDPRLVGDWKTAALHASRLRAQARADEDLPHSPSSQIVLVRNPGTNLDELVTVLAS